MFSGYRLPVSAEPFFVFLAPGNRNAVKHGRYSVPVRAARLATARAAFKEQQRRSDEWTKSCPQIDYDAICDGLGVLAKKLARQPEPPFLKLNPRPGAGVRTGEWLSLKESL